jgi:hypothetical protein
MCYVNHVTTITNLFTRVDAQVARQCRRSRERLAAVEELALVRFLARVRANVDGELGTRRAYLVTPVNVAL